MAGNNSTDWSDKQVFTTGEAAEICKVSQQTIIRCFDSGRLNGFRVPGSRFRRIPRPELLRFMRENDIPLGVIESGKRRVLVVDDDAEIVAMFRDFLEQDGRFDIRTASTGYDAGILTSSFKPHLIILDFMLPDINGDLVCKRLRSNPESAGTKIIFVSGVVKNEDVAQLMKVGADDFVKKPFDINQIIARMAELLDLESDQDMRQRNSA